MLAANERGVDIVRLLVIHSRLELQHGHLEEASRRALQAAALIAARKQPVNRDARDVALLMAQLQLAQQKNEQALRQAQAAVEFARTEAVDPKSSAWIGEALVWRARAETALGRKSAQATAQEALPHLLSNLDDSNRLILEARQIAAGPP